MSRGRFAPSPTGDLHLGGARTALCAWLAARRDGASFVLRMEDIDAPRVVPGAAARIVDDLRWLGLDWDEGPDVGGPHAPYDQSRRGALYQATLDRLMATGQVFRCWCSRAEVERASAAPHGPSDDGPRYPGTCRELSRARLAELERGSRRPSLRLRVEAGVVEHVDELAGLQRQDVAAAIGDFVLRRSDGLYAYQLAVVVDDLDMRIEEIVRGDDLLGSTPRQLLLYRALGVPPERMPRHAHVPLVLGPDGKRLAKRHGAITLRALRERGLSARQVLGRLAASLDLCAPDAQPAPADLLPSFSLHRLPRTPTLLPVES